jgi:PAB-dependent poly(A)-specific ribonuclease subunit 2
VSVCRGEGEQAGLPFIDDYIAVTETVVDYLTEWSGISPGDLSRETSPHAPVSLKHAYKKLWLLLNLGCVFVGHSLANDFRTINIHVPKVQVVDTSQLWFKPDFKRKLNLKFLAWCVLKVCCFAWLFYYSAICFVLKTYEADLLFFFFSAGEYSAGDA